MKICRKIFEYVQIMDEYRNVRMCPWLKGDGIIGSLLENSLEEIYHGGKAQYYRNKLNEGDYSICNIDQCPYLSNGAFLLTRDQIFSTSKFSLFNLFANLS